MVTPTLTISIDVGGTPLLLSGAVDANVWGILSYTAPPMQTRTVYAGDSSWVHGSVAVASVWQQTMLTFDAYPTASTETAVQAAIAQLTAAVAQFSYLVTVTVSDSPAVTWRADMGSVSPATREYEDLRDTDPAVTVSIPVYPIPVV